MKKLLFILVLFLWTPLVHAQCDYMRGAELSKLASNVKIGYTYEFKNDDVSFNVFMTNITNDIYVTDSYNTYFYNFESNKVYNRDDVLGFRPGDTITYNIYSNDNNCKGELLLTKYLKLPNYNSFYNMSQCDNDRDHRYCYLWENTSNVSYSNFDSTVGKSDDVISDNSFDFFETIKNIFSNSFVRTGSIILIVLIIISSIILFLRKRR